MRSTLILIFFLSGVSALVFQSLWFRLAGLTLGNSVWSASLVLAAFMGGMALGNGLVARFHNRLSRPVRMYAALELAIGLVGILAVVLLLRLPNLLGPVLGNLTDIPPLLNTARMVMAFGILLVPAIAMGATLPVIAQALSRQDLNFGASIGRLYGWNTMGAMLGAFSAELFLVPAFGILNSGLFAVMCNLIAVIIALRISQLHESASLPAPSTPDVPRPVGTVSRRYIFVAFISGALMLALEVVWFRFLLLAENGTGLIFAIMLAVVLGGIAAGGILAAKLFHRDERAFRLLRHVTALSAAMVVLTYWGFDLFTAYRVQSGPTISAFVAIATFLMFPVALLSGIAFTMVCRAVKDSLGSPARTAGIATFYNTVGAMLGSLGAGFVLLPMFGIEASLFLIAATYCLVALVVPVGEGTPNRTILWGRGAVAAAIVCLLFFPFGLMQRMYFAPSTPILPGHTLVAVQEGLVETIRYYQRDVFGVPKEYRLITNGYSMSGVNTLGKRYMKLYVYLPIALNPDSRDALLISYGVGSTAKALTDTRGLENIDIVDISADILEMSDIVYPGHDNPLRDERVRVHVEDGRFFLNTTNNRYDLITSEPPPPKIAGVVNLYSREYFHLIRERLKPGGFSSYWLPVYQLEPIETLAIIKAFCDAFDDCSLWSGAGMEWMLLGSNGAKRRVNTEQFSAQWREPLVGQELAALGLETPDQIGSLFIADSDLLDELTTDVDPVADNYPYRISSRLLRDAGYVYLYDRLLNEGERLLRFRNSELIDRLWPAKLKESSESYFQYERLIKNIFTAGDYRHPSDPYIWEAVDDLLENTTLSTLPLWLLGSDVDTQNIVVDLLEQEGYRDEFALELARKYTADRDYEKALFHMTSYLDNVGDVPHTDIDFYLYQLAKNGKSSEALPIMARLETVGWPGQDEFFNWFVTKFAPDGTEDTGPFVQRVQESTH